MGKQEAKRSDLTSSVLSHDRRQPLAAFFRKHRIASGLTIEEIAKGMGLEDSATLVSYESAQQPIPLDMIFSLTNFLNISPDEVLNLIYDLHGNQGQS
jgi:transcriptional regulator with XRE-family HTH domain